MDRNLETVDDFYNRKYAEVTRRLKLLYDRYGADEPKQGGSDAHELSDVVNALLDLRSQLRNLQWYGEVNRRGFIKILKKLDKKVPRTDAQDRYLASRVDPKPFATNHDLAQNMASINGWLSRVGDLKPAEESTSARSSFSMSRPLVSSYVDVPPEMVTELDEALMDDDIAGLCVALNNLQSSAVKAGQDVQGLFLSFLQRAMFHSSFHCIPLLLERIDNLVDGEDFHSRNCFHRLLINVGRARAAQAGQSQHSSPELDPIDSIAPAEAPALALNPYGLKELDSSRLVSGTDDTARLVRILVESLSGEQRSALSACDDFGRLPLHYAAKYGFVDVCHTLLAHMMAWSQLNTAHGLASIEWDDADGSTPLHLAVINGWRLTVQTLLDACKHLSGVDPVHPLKNWRRSTEILAMATRANFDKIVGLLVSAGADVDSPDEQGETSLHISARFGHEDCAKAILNATKDAPVNLDLPEKTFGWTPLFIASVDGHYDMVKLLVDAGADLSRCDSSGWTAKEHAALRGHIKIAELLAQHTPLTSPPSPQLRTKISDATPRPCSVGDRGSSGISKENVNARNIPPPVKTFGHRYLQKDNMILVSLGSMDQRKNQKPIELDKIPLSEAHATQLDTALSVVVSAKGAKGEESIVDLPVQDNISTEPFSFRTQDISKVKLFFDIVPTYAGSNDDKLGRAVAVLSSIKTNVGSKRINLQGDMSVPIMATKTMEVIGSVNFNFIIVTPFGHENMSISETHTYWKSLSEPMVIGHRGLGKNLSARKSLQLGENTIQSFIAAANLGATYVEFDVQLTKDHVPVIYHDFLVSETGIDAPVHTLTLEQFLHVNDATPQHSRQHSPSRHQANGTINGVYTNGASSGHDSPRLRPKRANSLSAVDATEGRPDLMAERMKHTRDFKLKGYKGNSRGNFIQAPFTTLEEMFRTLPESTGFNIEMKYPMLFESEEQEMDTYAVELNEFVDTVLRMVYDLGGSRNVIFSSFHPDICLLLSLKQPSRPILFLTDAGTSDVGDIRASSLQEAIRFASRWNLLGVVSAAEPLVMCPRLVRVVKESGLVCVSYGTLNNEPDNVKLQVKEGIDAVIVDNVLAVRKGLTAAEEKKLMGSRDARENGVTVGEGADENKETIVNGVNLGAGLAVNGAVV